MLKRLFDIKTAVVGLIVLSPFFILIALLIATTSRGGIFFRQTRIGRGGTPFRIFKFRTMTPTDGAEAGRFDLADQSRVTAIGRVLRRTKLDELPQLFNVLVGSMSIVGPRPEVERWTCEYPERWRIVHTVRPGITDLASIEFRDEEKLLSAADDPEACYRDVILPRKLDFYETYADQHSMWGDCAIVLRTMALLIGVGKPSANER